MLLIDQICASQFNYFREIPCSTKRSRLDGLWLSIDVARRQIGLLHQVDIVDQIASDIDVQLGLVGHDVKLLKVSAHGGCASNNMFLF
ncbi:MAG: hypothetical protein JNM18_26260 [Planctomycetaceae bacterium]|nr:hypothetical protein [Planctomycetaceae bacterium]